MASNGLQHLPNEITESIVKLLPLADVGSLRLSSRTLNTAVVQGYYKSHLRSKKVDLSRQGLEKFAEAMDSPRLVDCLQELDLVGIIYDTRRLQARVNEGRRKDDADMRQAEEALKALQCGRDQLHDLWNSQEDIRLLSTAFQKLAARCKLDRVSISAVVYDTDPAQRVATPAVTGEGWAETWDVAIRSFHTTLDAIAESRLKVNKLRIFWDERICSLACTEFAKIDWKYSLMGSIGGLRSLSLSFSDRHIELSEDDFDEGADADYCIGLATFLDHCVSLEELKLYRYDLYGPSAEGRLVQHIAGTVGAQHLKKLTLRGMIGREQDLCSLLRSTTLEEVHLEQIGLCEGTFRGIIDSCSSETKSLKHLYLDALYGPPCISCEEPPDSQQWTSKLFRVGPDAVKSIVYRNMVEGRRAVDSPANRERAVQHRLKWGPRRQGDLRSQ